MPPHLHSRSASRSTYLTPSSSLTSASVLLTPQGSPPLPAYDLDDGPNPSQWQTQERYSSSYLTPPVSDDEDSSDADGAGAAEEGRARKGGTRRARAWPRGESGDWGVPGRRRTTTGLGDRMRRGYGRVLRLSGLRVGGRRRAWVVGVVVFLLLVGGLMGSRSGPGGKGKSWWARRDRHVAWTHPERDTIVFYTILGSDLPPRHSPNQTLTNLDFLLANEDLSLPFRSSLPFFVPETLKIERRFLLNRMVPGVDRDRVVGVLEGRGKKWDEVEWTEDEWREVGFRWDGLGEGGGLWGFGGNKTLGGGDEGADLGREGWKELDWALSDKNRYAMNNNGARNTAIALGLASPSTRYAFPLDSNCAFTQAGLAALLDTISASESLERGGKAEGQAKDFITVPMSRLLSNADFTTWNEPVRLASVEGVSAKESQWERLRPDAPAEPQIGFRFTSTTRFSPLFRYGRRPKLSLLWSLGWVPLSKSLHLKTHPWEIPDRLITAQSHDSLKSKAAMGGWTMRLFSGNPELEREDELGVGKRAGKRVEGVVGYLEGLEVRWGRPDVVEEGVRKWGFVGSGSGPSEEGPSLVDQLLDPSRYTSYGSPILLLHSPDSLSGYAFPAFPATKPPSAPPETYTFPFDPLSYSPLPLLAHLSTLPPTSTTPFLPLLRNLQHYYLHSPSSLSLSSSATHSAREKARYDLHLAAVSFFFEDWTVVSRIATRVGLRVEILLRSEGGLGEGAWEVWEELRKGLEGGGWKGWGWWEGGWEWEGRRVGWDGLKDIGK